MTVFGRVNLNGKESAALKFKLDDLTDILDRRSYGPGKVIFREGQSASTAFIVLEGQVELTVGAGDDTKFLTSVVPGQMFGELALTIGRDRTATASTMGGCAVLVLPASSVKSKLDKADPFLRYWIEYLMERVVDLSSRVD